LVASMAAPLLLRDRIRGALLGAVVGDAFGSLLEGSGPRNADLLVQRRAEHRGPWRHTDDGAMFIALAETIRDCSTVHPRFFLAAVSRRYEPARGFGRGMKIALQALATGTPWPDVARAAWPEGSRGNGGAVRVGAVALRRWVTADDRVRAAIRATEIRAAVARVALPSALGGARRGSRSPGRWPAPPSRSPMDTATVTGQRCRARYGPL